jgi:8-oxo-dGTP diphosphatase
MKVRPAALILNNGSVLTMRYQYGSEFLYVLPGGNPDAGEALPAALERELQEELQIKVEVGAMVMSGEVLEFGKKEDCLHCLFLGTLTEGVPEIDREHTTAESVEWIPLDRLQEVALYPNFAPYLTVGFSTDTCLYTGPLEQVYVG